MTEKSVDSATLEAIRKGLRLRNADMAQLCGVSRITYYHWVKGNHPMKPKNVDGVSRAMRTLLAVHKDGWFLQPRVNALTAEERFKELMAYIEQLPTTTEE